MVAYRGLALYPSVNFTKPAYPMLRLVVIPVVALLFTPAHAQVNPVEFLGMKVPGRLAEAKAGGFTECAADYYAFKCKRSVETQVHGVRAHTAEVALDGKEHFTETYKASKHDGKDVRSLPTEVLGYGSITLLFNKSQYDYKCEEKHRVPGKYSRPSRCITNKGTIDQLEDALEANGWVKYNLRGRYKSYVKPGEPVEIATQQEYATVRRIAPSERDQLLANVASRKAAEASKQNSADAVIQQMKAK